MHTGNYLSYIDPPDFSFSTTQLKYGTRPTVCYSTVDPPTSLRCYPATAMPTLLFRYNAAIPLYGCRYSLTPHRTQDAHLGSTFENTRLKNNNPVRRIN